ncbi:MAG: HAD family hydrolase, partial [Tannerellaceae bacterium]|nr:HAD family hydrolase [Tannerellaceae bacterium]
YGNIQAVLADFGVDSFFPSIIESAIVGVRKPDPAIFMLGVEALNLKPSEVTVIGDSYRKDIQPAQSLGCETIWIKGIGWDESEDKIDHPAIITDFSELCNLL